MRSFADDLEASLAHLKLPVVHRKHIRTTNLVERSFEEERRRAKVIPRFRGEKASGERPPWHDPDLLFYRENGT